MHGAFDLSTLFGLALKVFLGPANASAAQIVINCDKGVSVNLPGMLGHSVGSAILPLVG